MAAARSKKPKIVVGWNELVDLPEWGVSGVRAKIDTGARSSSLHVEEMTVLAGGRVRFVLPVGHRHLTVETDVVRKARVRSSNGHYTQRLFVRAGLTLGPLTRPVEVNLVFRGDMQFPMLIGRTALKGRYVVDPGKVRLVSPRDSD